MRNGIALFLGMLLSVSVAFATFDRDEQYVIQYQATGVALSTGVVIIDLSDAVITATSTTHPKFISYPHVLTGEVRITGGKVWFDGIDNSTASARLGVLTGVNASTGNVTSFFVAIGSRTPSINPIPGDFRIRVSTGATPMFFLSNVVNQVSTLFQTDLPAPAPIGFVTPAAGDIVAIITGDSRTAPTVYIELIYTTER